MGGIFLCSTRTTLNRDSLNYTRIRQTPKKKKVHHTSALVIGHLKKGLEFVRWGEVITQSP